MPKDLKTLPADSLPYREHRLPVSDIHELYIAEYGNPLANLVAVVCHGGPGAGSSPFYASYFDLQQYRVILFDQRGAGQSTPKGVMEDNRSQDLVADMEKIRQHLQIDTWLIMGGSWGSTLALLYAEQYPQRTEALVLRGVFLGRHEDTRAFLNDDSPAAKMRSKVWRRFKLELAQLQQAAKLTPTKDYVEDLYQLLHHSDPSIPSRVSALLCWWEEHISFLVPDKAAIEWSNTPDGINMGRTEITYLYADCFLTENQILNNITAIKNIPTYIVQGEYDLVCPAYQADDLEACLNQVTRFNPCAGHSTREPETIHFLMLALEELRNKLRPD